MFLRGIEKEAINIYGASSLQAICLGLMFARSQLEYKLKHGSRLIELKENIDLPLDECFGVLPRMSWRVMVQKFPHDIETIQQLPHDFKPPAIGSRMEVAQAIRTAFPHTNISDLSWLVIDGDEFKIEVSVGYREPCDGFMLHVQGGNATIDAVMQLINLFEARAYDMTLNEFFDRMADPYRVYRERYAEMLKITPDSALSLM